MLGSTTNFANLRDPVNMEFEHSLFACCLDIFSIHIVARSFGIRSCHSFRRECNGHCQSLHSSLLEVLLLTRCIAPLSTLISYVASGPELIASCVLRFSSTTSSFAPSLAFPCSHLTSLCLSVRVYIFPSLQDGYSVRSVLTRSLPASHISFSIVAVPVGLLAHIVPPKLNVEPMGHPTGRIVHFCAGSAQ